MRKFVIFLVSLFAAFSLRAQAPFLEQLQPRDSILIADQLLYGIKAENVPEGTLWFMPQYKDTICAGVGVITPWVCDTLKVHKPGKKSPVKSYDLKIATVVTSFNEGEYNLPPLEVVRQNPDGKVDSLLFDSIRFEVRTMPVDTATFSPHDLKDVVRYPLTAREVLPWVLLAYLIIAVIVAVVCLVMIYRKRASGGDEVREPAHITALRKLESYRGDKLWVPEKQKQFWSGVTDVLREYIASRYGIGAMEMTTSEIFNELKPQFDAEDSGKKFLIDEVETMFVTADFIKFAKHTASAQENASVLPLAVKFVTSTCQTEVAEENEVSENKEEK